MPYTPTLLTALQNIAHMLPAIEDIDDGLRRALESSIEAVDATGGSILFHDPVKRQLCFRHVLGGTTGGAKHTIGFALIGVCLDDNEGIAGQVFQSGHPQIDNNVAENPQHHVETDDEFGYQTKSLATVPISFPGGKPIGVMQLLNKQGGDFTDEDLIILDVIGTICAMSVALHQNKVSGLLPTF